MAFYEEEWEVKVLYEYLTHTCDIASQLQFLCSGDIIQTGISESHII